MSLMNFLRLCDTFLYLILTAPFFSHTRRFENLCGSPLSSPPTLGMAMSTAVTVPRRFIVLGTSIGCGSEERKSNRIEWRGQVRESRNLIFTHQIFNWRFDDCRKREVDLVGLLRPPLESCGRVSLIMRKRFQCLAPTPTSPLGHTLALCHLP